MVTEAARGRTDGRTDGQAVWGRELLEKWSLSPPLPPDQSDAAKYKTQTSRRRPQRRGDAPSVRAPSAPPEGSMGWQGWPSALPCSLSAGTNCPASEVLGSRLEDHPPPRSGCCEPSRRWCSWTGPCGWISRSREAAGPVGRSGSGGLRAGDAPLAARGLREVGSRRDAHTAAPPVSPLGRGRA